MNKQTDNHPLIIGDVYMVKFGESGMGNEQCGWRPGVVFQNNKGNAYSPNVVVLPFTTSIKKKYQPTHVFVEAEDSGMPRDSMVLCENPECVSKERLGKYITTLSEKYMKKITEAYLLSSSCISYLDPEALIILWQRAAMLNSKMLCA